ncbi:MAG: GrpB family protein [Chloroflexota bacterium]
MENTVIVTRYNPNWARQFVQLSVPIRDAMGETAIRIDHIGSTSVVGLAAKPIIDMQISVLSFEPFDAILVPLQSLGYRWQVDNPAKTKRYFREPFGQPEIHIHVRLAGSYYEQHALLFRDYLRENIADRRAYRDLKLTLAEKFADDRKTYQQEKSAFIWEITRRAHSWGSATGWFAGERDV